MKRFEIISKNVNHTIEIAKEISKCFCSSDIIVLGGALGAGKTHFVKGFSEGLKCSNTVTSPTFSIANFYKNSEQYVLHIDLYRIESIEELNDLGLDEYFESSIVLIEWGEKFAQFFDDYLLISIEHFEQNKEKRKIKFSSNSKYYNTKIEKISKYLKASNL